MLGINDPGSTQCPQRVEPGGPITVAADGRFRRIALRN
jgi:hypothetical protein